MLTTGRVIYHWHGAEMTRRARGLNAVYPEALIEINPRMPGTPASPTAR